MKPFSVNPCIRLDKPLKNGNYPIYFRVMVWGEESKIPTGFDIDKNLWDSKSKLPKKTPLRTVIGNLKAELETCLLTELGMGGELSLKLVKDFFSGKKES